MLLERQEEAHGCGCSFSAALRISIQCDGFAAFEAHVNLKPAVSMSCGVGSCTSPVAKVWLMIRWYSTLTRCKQVLHDGAPSWHAGFDFFKGFLAVLGNELRFFFEFQIQF